MYSVQIPVINRNLCREKTLAELKRAGARRVWLSTSFRGIESEARMAEELELFRENRIFFEEEGMEVGIWISSLGHGGPLVQDDPDGLARAEQYEKWVGLEGETCGDSFCPTGEAFANDFARWAGRVAETGVKMIMIDDDYRLSIRGCGNGCCCDRHMAEYSKRVGRLVTREQLRELVFTGGPSRYRDAWLDLCRDSLVGLAKRVRERVDQVNPEIRMSICAVMSTWDIDGADSIELARTLAGGTKPFLRTIGAPYWATNSPRRRLGYVINLNRMQRQWCEGEGIELFSEADAYPRPRYATPASYLEMYDMALRADGGWDGILKYVIDYTSSEDYEKGYIDRMVRNRPAYDWIGKHMAGGKAEGADIVSHMKRLRNAVLPEDVTMDEVNEAYFFPSANFTACDCGLPTAFGTKGAHMVFGENGRYVTAEQMKDGLVLDLPAAMLLMERGIDAGIEEAGPAQTVSGLERFPAQNERVIVGAMNRHRDVTLKAGAEVLSEIDGHTTAYRYENAQGMRFLVYPFDMDVSCASLGVTRSYCRQKQLIDGLEWVGRKKLPAVCTGHPDIYLLCKRTEEGLAVGLWNLSADYIADAEIRLDGAYRLHSLFGAEGAVQGDTLKLTGDIAPYAFVGALLKN